jgi:hypothetical protein
MQKINNTAPSKAICCIGLTCLKTGSNVVALSGYQLIKLQLKLKTKEQQRVCADCGSRGCDGPCDVAHRHRSAKQTAGFIPVQVY